MRGRIKTKPMTLPAVLILSLFLIAGCSSQETQSPSEESSLLSHSSKEEAQQGSEEEWVPLSYYDESDLELPVHGATGYAAIALELKEEKNKAAESRALMPAGQAFRILQESGEWWYVETEEAAGWVEHLYCLINLPDVVPSIIYDNTNSYSSRYVSSGKPIPNVTGERLYEAKTYNERLEKEEYLIPLLYETAKKVAQAQQSALAAGDTLILYEAYRPSSVQEKVSENLRTLAEADEEVLKGISTAPWYIDWFIVTDVSNHQRGFAIDAGLAKVEATEKVVVGSYEYTAVSEYTPYTMPTPIHELSAYSKTLEKPVTSRSKTAWREIPVASSMNEAALALQSYMTEAGLTPLASEWWHFNDLDTREALGEQIGIGLFEVSTNVSAVPVSHSQWQ